MYKSFNARDKKIRSPLFHAQSSEQRIGRAFAHLRARLIARVEPPVICLFRHFCLSSIIYPTLF